MGWKYTTTWLLVGLTLIGCDSDGVARDPIDCQKIIDGTAQLRCEPGQVVVCMKMGETLITDKQWITQWSPGRSGDFEVVQQTPGVDWVRLAMAPDISGDYVQNGGVLLELHPGGACKLLSYTSYNVDPAAGRSLSFRECAERALVSVCGIDSQVFFRIREVTEFDEDQVCHPDSSISDLVGCVGATPD
jgi:hypothetical protein